MSSRLWSYVCDVEGNGTYWNKFINLSKVLSRSDNGNLQLKENCGFIFGGDSVDKGDYDIRIVNDLLQLKKDYPSRVHLIIGNRDANKLRFAAELQDEESLCIPYWVDKEKRVSLESFLEKHKLSNTKINRLKWMLCETMGSATTFDFRKNELKELGKDFDDESVVNSFINSTNPSSDDNFMLKYLRNANLMIRINNTLFVHGGISDNNIGCVPGCSDIKNIDDWASSLNLWVQEQLDEYEKQQTWIEKPSDNNEKGNRGGNGLMDYGVPGGNNNKTVVYCTFVDNCKPVNVSEKVIDYLSKNNINQVIVGHQPVGDCPTIISSNDKVQILLVDTSYSDMSAPNLRGNAVSEVLFNEEDNSIYVHGYLKDNKEIEYNLACPQHKILSKDIEPNLLLGKQVKNGNWVKTILKNKPEDNKEYITYHPEGYKLIYEYLTEEEVKEQLLE